MSSTMVAPTLMTPHSYPIGHHSYSSVTKNGQKLFKNMGFFTYAFTRSHSTHECPYGQTNGVQCSYNTTQSGPLLHDPTHIPY